MHWKGQAGGKKGVFQFFFLSPHMPLYEFSVEWKFSSLDAANTSGNVVALLQRLGEFFLGFIFLFISRVPSSCSLPFTALFLLLLLTYDPLQTPRDQLQQIRLESVHPSAATSGWIAPGLNRCLLWLSTTVLHETEI